MAQTEINIRTTDPGGTGADVTQLCRSVTWSGSWRDVARTLSFSPAVSELDTNLPAAPTEPGGSVQFRYGDTLLMDAFSLERTRDSLSHTIDVTAYDRGLYLTRNSKYIRVEDQTAEGVTAALCGEFGIPVGSLASTGVTFSRNFLGVNLYKIIMTMYTLASDVTGKKYRIRFRGTDLEVVEAAQTGESILLKPGCNLLSCTTRESAKAMTNSVAIYDDEFNKLSTQEDTELIRLYGLMQAAIRAGAYDDPAAHAKQILAENGLQTTITLNALGNVKLITGNTVAVEEPVTGTCGLFWIQSDTHTWKNNIYQTRVTLSLEALMDSQTAGSLPTE